MRKAWNTAGQRASSRRVPQLVVRALSAKTTIGFVELGHLRAPCALGRGGVKALKREGDGVTPRGIWPVREAMFHPSRLRRPSTRLPVRAINADDGWCDAPSDRNYNRLVRHPYPASAERLRREDGVYDALIVLGYNDRPRIQGRGSAIFLHVARPGYPPTEGCIAVSRDCLLRLLAMMRRDSVVRIAL